MSNKPTIPTKVSQLTNDSGYTTNTGTVTGVKVGSTSYSPSSGIVSLPAYPTTLPASDVSSWAKASSKPTYTASEVGLGNVGNFKAVSTVASQGLSSTEQSNARANIGAGTSSFSGSYSDLSNKPTIPTKTSQLTNDSGYTTNTGTVTGVKVGSTSYSPSSGVVSLPAYPTTLPASDVSSWAKASSKPTYTASEVGLGNVGNFKAVSTVASQGLTSTEKSNARANIGAGTSSFSGSYNDLSNKPTIPTTYAGSSSAGGAATSANKLNTNAGSATQPVYFSNGVPAATTYSLGKSVPSNAVFTDTHRAIKVDGTQVLASNSTALNFIGTGHVHVAHDSSNPGNITFYEENWLTFVDLEVALGDLTWTASSSSPGMYYSGNVSVYRSGTKPAFSFILGASIMDFNALPVAFISVGLSGTSSIWLLSNTNNFQSYTKLNLRIFGLISFGEA